MSDKLKACPLIKFIHDNKFDCGHSRDVVKVSKLVKFLEDDKSRRESRDRSAEQNIIADRNRDIKEIREILKDLRETYIKLQLSNKEMREDKADLIKWVMDKIEYHKCHDDVDHEHAYIDVLNKLKGDEK